MNNLFEYLEETVKRVPDKCAFANEKEEYSFLQTYRMARAAASVLCRFSCHKKPIVVFMRKHPKNIIAFLSVLASGNFYVPIDEDMPMARIELILENIQANIIICDNDTFGTVKIWKKEYKVYRFDEMISEEEDDELLFHVKKRSLDTDAAYVIFTSGSTGVPKGVVASHRSVMDYIDQLTQELGFTEECIFANQAPLTFDAPLKELGPTLKMGATTIMVPKELFLFPVKLVEFLNQHKINTICWVVSALTMISGLNTFDKIKPKYLQKVVFVGEVFPMNQFQIWRKALPEVAFTNLYGPTEGTGVCCYYHVNREFTEGEAMPIGRPFPNTEILLLDKDDEHAGQGEEGEICIRGASLTLGYYNDFEKTRECFVQNPLNKFYPELIYRTGDIGRYNEFGELMFVSRIDNQIKHMGHRIELGEIETHALTNEKVQSTCCLYDYAKGKILLIFVGEIEERSLAVYLKERLPRYMMPNRLRSIVELPLTPNGKTDRRKLMEQFT